jgi:sugar phosphate isomerase/epimerase
MKSSRRQFLHSAAGLAAAPALALGSGPTGKVSRPDRFRLAICNETFQGLDFPAACKGARTAGYGGIEVAPFTLADDPAALPASRRKELRDVMASEGVAFVGLHYLLTAPKGLHVTTPDAAVRRKSWQHVGKLIDLCADLGPDGIMVLGSGKQRSTVGGSTVRDATARLRDGLAEVAPHARDRGVTLLLEALAPHLSDVITSLEEAAAIVKEIGSPALATLFDVHNAVKEKLPHAELVRKYYPYIRHVEVMEPDGRFPGTGSYDFKPVLQALRDLGYPGWVALEVFDFKPGGQKIADDSYRFLRGEEARLR